ncbi:hypothetical protein [Maribellus sediminis]|uniref:hypothetical protein n=1 Tax=Maribellus sediminis TaxID=2696285 RepID=UPI001430A548|nr:hypothetical protein [Maribellus sediminis]
MNKIYLLLMLFALALASCDQDNIGTIYEPDGPYVSFATSVVPDNVLSADNNFSVNCVLVRSDLKGSATANIELEMNADIDGVFALENNSVTFEDGKGTAYVKIVPLVSPDQLDPTKAYVFNLTITSDNASELFNTATYKAGFKFDYVGTANFNSEFFEDIWDVEVYKLVVGSKTLYKLKELYDVGIDVTVIVENNIITIEEQVGWYSNTYESDVHVLGSGTMSGKVLTMTIEHLIPDLGSYGEYNEVLTLP